MPLLASRHLPTKTLHADQVVRFQLSPAVVGTLLGVIRGLCAADAPTTFRSAGLKGSQILYLNMCTLM